MKGVQVGRQMVTPREVQVLRLLSVGMTTEEAAEELGIAKHTARTHVQHALARTRSRNRVHLVARFVRREFEDPPIAPGLTCDGCGDELIVGEVHECPVLGTEVRIESVA